MGPDEKGHRNDVSVCSTLLRQWQQKLGSRNGSLLVGDDEQLCRRGLRNDEPMPSFGVFQAN
jgi:hypothetical protein